MKDLKALKEIRLKEEDKRMKDWMNNLVTNALEQEEVEDFLYEHRWECFDEESRRLWCCLYPLWAARVCKRSKEEMEALYQKGYRYIHKLSQKGYVWEIMGFDWKIVEVYTEEAVVSENVVSVITETIENDRYPAILLNEYDQLERNLKEKVRCELFVKMMDEYGAGKDGGAKQEAFMQKMEQLFPVVYKDWMRVSVTELLFCIKEKVEICAKYIEKYLEYHQGDAERIQQLEEYLSDRYEEQK